MSRVVLYVARREISAAWVNIGDIVCATEVFTTGRRLPDGSAAGGFVSHLAEIMKQVG